MTTSQKFTEAKLEQAIIELLERQDYPYTRGTDLERSPNDALIRSDLREFLASRYAADQITDGRQPMNRFQPFGKTSKTNVTKPVQFSAKAMS